MKTFSTLRFSCKKMIAILILAALLLTILPMTGRFSVHAAAVSPSGYDVSATYNFFNATTGGAFTGESGGAGSAGPGTQFSSLNAENGNLLYGKIAFLSGVVAGVSKNTGLLNAGMDFLDVNCTYYTDSILRPLATSNIDFAKSESAIQPLQKSGSTWIVNSAFNYQNYNHLDALDTYYDITFYLGGMTAFDSFHMWDHWNAELRTYIAQVYVGESMAALGSQTAADAVLTFFNQEATNNGYHFTFNGTEKPVGRYLRVRIYAPNMPNTTQAALRSRVSEIAAFGSTVPDTDTPLDLPMYQQDLYLSPVWEGDTVYNETAMFYNDRESISLLYPIKDIVSVRSYSLSLLYEEGTDYTVTSDGKLQIASGSRIPIFGGDISGSTDLKNDCPQYQISVTYTHDSTWDDGYTPIKPESQIPKFPKLFAKLKNKQSTNIVFYGDSIMVGMNASGVNQPTLNFAASPDKSAEALYNADPNYVAKMNLMPYMPSFPNLIVDQLKVLYGFTDINMINKAVGSASSLWGVQNADYQLRATDPDLIVIGYGMNDGTDEALYQTQIGNIVADILTDDGTDGDVYYPNAEILLVSRMNRADVSRDVKLMEMEASLYSIAEEYENVAVAPVTSMYLNMAKSKEYIDYTGNGINHPNDFGARIYAQTILSVLDTSDYPDLLTGLSVTPPTKVTYAWGETLNTDGMVVTANYAVGNDVILDNGDCTISEIVYNNLGTQAITVSYGGKTATFNVTVTDLLTGISVTPPTKVTYAWGEALNTAGMVVTANYASGNEEVLSSNSYTVSSIAYNNSSNLGEQTITVSFQGKTATFKVSVADLLTGISVTPPTKTTYVWGEELNTSGMVVTAHYASGNEEVLSSNSYTVSSIVYDDSGTKGTITVGYGGKTATFTVTISEKSDDLPSSGGTSSKDDGSSSKTDDSPQTGDISRILWMLLATSSLTIVFFIFTRRKHLKN